jgi:hypothetical protein
MGGIFQTNQLMISDWSWLESMVVIAGKSLLLLIAGLMLFSLLLLGALWKIFSGIRSGMPGSRIPLFILKQMSSALAWWTALLLALSLWAFSSLSAAWILGLSLLSLILSRKISRFALRMMLLRRFGLLFRLARGARLVINLFRTRYA